MSLKLEDIIEEMGLELPDVEKATIDDFKAARDKKFVSLTNAKTHPEVVGPFFKGQAKKLKEAFQSLHGDDWKPEDVDWTKPESILEAGAKETQRKIQELSEKAGAGDDKKLELLQKEAETWKNKYSQLDEMHKTVKTDFEKFQSEADGKLKNFKRDNKIAAEYLPKIPFSEQASKREIGYFLEKEIPEKYSFEWDDEKQDIVPYDKKTGQPVKTPQGHDVDNYVSLITREAEAANLLKKAQGSSNYGQYQQGQQQQRQQGGQQQQSNNTGRKIPNRPTV